MATAHSKRRRLQACVRPRACLTCRVRSGRDGRRMSSAVLTDEMWARVEPLLPPLKGPMGSSFRPHRAILERMIYFGRTGLRGTCRASSVHGKLCTAGSAPGPRTARWTGCWPS